MGSSTYIKGAFGLSKECLVLWVSYPYLKIKLTQESNGMCKNREMGYVPFRGKERVGRLDLVKE